MVKLLFCVLLIFGLLLFKNDLLSFLNMILAGLEVAKNPLTEILGVLVKLIKLPFEFYYLRIFLFIVIGFGGIRLVYRLLQGKE